MNIYKEASRTQLRVSTSQGLLSVEQLWDLNLNKLSTIIKSVKKLIKTDNDDDLSFLDETKTIDRKMELTFEVLKDIYTTKKSELDAERKSVSDKEHNEAILKLIKSKQDQELSNKSVDELMSMLK